MKPNFIKFFIFCLSLCLLTACSNFHYLLETSIGQLALLSKKISIEEALKKYDFTEEQQNKLRLVPKLKSYAKKQLQLDIDKDIYSTYVDVGKPNVTYLLRVSLAYELKAYTWTFPITGTVPYKGFFDREDAIKEAKSFPKEQYDVYVRGVTAYSTLGWFADPILSSMLRYDENNFVLLIFHELAHTVLFFKDHINFNERFAEFIGRQATLSYYQNKEGEESATVRKLKSSWRDQLLFSSFMVQEYNSLKDWYKSNKDNITAQQKAARIKEIQTRFLTEVHPQLSSNDYDYFTTIELNNAKLLSYRSYNYKMDEFEKLFNSAKINRNIKTFIEYCKQFANTKNPEKALSEAVKNL